MALLVVEYEHCYFRKFLLLNVEWSYPTYYYELFGEISEKKILP